MDKEQKFTIALTQEIILPERNLEEIKAKIANTDIMLIGEDLHQLTDLDEKMEKYRAEFLQKVKEAFAAYDENHDKLKEAINEVKARALEHVKNTSRIEEKIKIGKDGIAIKEENLKYNLPSGIAYVSGTTTYDYDESKITDEQYWKKELKKTAVKAAVKEGKLSADVLIEKRGEPSIRITSASLVKGIENKNE